MLCAVDIKEVYIIRRGRGRVNFRRNAIIEFLHLLHALLLSTLRKISLRLQAIKFRGSLRSRLSAKRRFLVESTYQRLTILRGGIALAAARPKRTSLFIFARASRSLPLAFCPRTRGGESPGRRISGSGERERPVHAPAAIIPNWYIHTCIYVQRAYVPENDGGIARVRRLPDPEEARSQRQHTQGRIKDVPSQRPRRPLGGPGRRWVVLGL